MRNEVISDVVIFLYIAGKRVANITWLFDFFWFAILIAVLINIVKCP